MMNRRAKIAISTSVALCGVQIVVAEPADTLQRTKVLSEVVVTASESRKATSASRIDVTALKHLQPSSFTDILELLPGGRAVDPAMGTVNSIRLREAGKDATSDISSLGVSFVVDGVTLNADANMQYITGTYLGSGLSSVSKGVDMRTISTDNIESVEVVRGIPSVAYGNITSGTVIINRRSSASPFSARFKADLKSRLLSVGKGIVTDASGCRTLNIDLNYLDSKITPTDSRKNFSRITASARFVSRSIGDNGAEVRWNVATDYTGSFDCIKHDKDATSKIDEFRSRYNSFSLSGGMSLKAPPHSLLKEVNVKTSFKQEFDLMTESRSVAIDRPMAIPCSTEEGEAYGIYLPYSYDAYMKVDGKPFYANVSADAKLGWQCEPIFSYLRIGAEWTMSANNGEGQVYDALRPLNYSTTVRPRRYSDIPALNNVAAYCEEQLKLYLGRHTLSINAGVRLQALARLSSAFTMSGKVFADPRCDIQWTLPAPSDMRIAFSGGLGWLSRMPTQAQLYPDAKYVDIVELNYYSTNPAERAVYLMTYKWDNTNYELRPARNFKWEIRADVSYKGNRLTATYFREAMNNAFSSQGYYRIMPYKKYTDVSLSASTPDTLISTFTRIGNACRVRKEGVEFQFSSRRFDALSTRITLSGAWFKTIYSTNSRQYKSQSIMLDNKQLQYVGLYDWEDGTEYQSFNTNCMFDTYLRRLGLSVSLSAQCTWFTSTRNLWNDGTPVAYVDRSGNISAFTDADKSNIQLKHLVINYSGSYFDEYRVPFAMDFNLKATKEIGQYLTMALYVNRIVSIYPDYHRGEQIVRRSSTPYFGMEANLKF